MKKSTGMMLGTVGAAAIVLAACGGRSKFRRAGHYLFKC